MQSVSLSQDENLHVSCLISTLSAHLVFAGEKLVWFQNQLNPAKEEYTKQDACGIIER